MRELVSDGVMSVPNYKRLSAAGRFEVARRGGGSANSYALIVVDSLPTRYREVVTSRHPEGGNVLLAGWVRSNYERDQAAATYFFSPEKCGLQLPAEKAQEYVTNASTLNCCIRLYERAATAQKLMGGKYDWTQMAECIESLRDQFGHTLPTSPLRFRKKVAEYKREGYACLISGKYGNQSARKVDHKTERLILGIAVLPNKPYNTNVGELYNQFVCGELDIYDPETGEAFNPDDFTDKNGEPQVLSESTIANYLNKPKNRVLIEHKLNSYTTFMHEQMPHMHRHDGEFSLSKVTFDDRDLPRKLKDTKVRPKAYYAYDVTSQCCIGYAYNRNKNVDLVVDMFRNMFRLLDRKGWGCPAEVEVENHLMSQWRDSFLRAGVMFPFVRFCAPMNSQEKRAENFNNAKKRSIEHRNHIGIGRFYAKSRQYRTESKKVFDEKNDTYVEKDYYTWDELIADDIEDIRQFNNSLHPNQKKYPGMTRWEVLEANINPTLAPLDKAMIARYVGERVSTTVRRNSYCRVSYEDWWLSETSVLEKLAPNNYKVDAYYLTDENGAISDVYIFQNDMLIDKLQNVGTYNTATAEQTEEDRAVFVEQRKKVAEFGSYVKANEVSRVGIARAETSPPGHIPKDVGEIEVPAAVPETSQTEITEYADGLDYVSAGLESL
jgi:hypothetical protein